MPSPPAGTCCCEEFNAVVPEPVELLSLQSIWLKATMMTSAAITRARRRRSARIAKKRFLRARKVRLESRTNDVLALDPRT
jgi:hypothetical protein